MRADISDAHDTDPGVGRHLLGIPFQWVRTPHDFKRRGPAVVAVQGAAVPIGWV